MITQEQVDNIIKDFKAALKLYLKKDKKQFTKDSSERSKVFRIAYYLQTIIESNKEIYKDIVVDCEYNRICTTVNDKIMINPKTLIKYTGETTTFSPDLIVHKRNDSKHNLLICEFKNLVDDDYDKYKIENATNNIDYMYRVGFCINLSDINFITDINNLTFKYSGDIYEDICN